MNRYTKKSNEINLLIIHLAPQKGRHTSAFGYIQCKHCDAYEDCLQKSSSHVVRARFMLHLTSCAIIQMIFFVVGAIVICIMYGCWMLTRIVKNRQRWQFFSMKFSFKPSPNPRHENFMKIHFAPVIIYGSRVDANAFTTMNILHPSYASS